MRQQIWQRAEELAQDPSLIEKFKLTFSETRRARHAIEREIQARLCQMNRLAALKQRAQREMILAGRSKKVAEILTDFKEEQQNLLASSAQKAEQAIRKKRASVSRAKQRLQDGRFIASRVLIQHKRHQAKVLKQDIQKKKEEYRQSQLRRQIEEICAQPERKPLGNGRVKRLNKTDSFLRQSRSRVEAQLQRNLQQQIYALQQRKSSLLAEVNQSAEQRQELQKHLSELNKMRQEHARRRSRGG